MGVTFVRKILFGLLLAALAGASVDGAQAGGCRPVSADNPMTTRATFGIATCRAWLPPYHFFDFIGESARGYVHRRPSDPMVWSDAMWRSTLFDGYSETYNDMFDLRFRRRAYFAPWLAARRIEQRIVIRETLSAAEVVGDAGRRRAKVLNMRTKQVVQPLENSSRFAGHRCSGILVLTWKAGGARSRCHEGTTRIRNY
jgi:hypothetical protein